MMRDRTTIILPDVHLGWKHQVPVATGSWVHETELWQFLDELAQRPKPPNVVILGDLVDFERDEPMHGYLRVSAFLADHFRRLCERGARVYWVLGNHDHHIYDLIRGRTPLLELVRHNPALFGPEPGARQFISQLEQLLFENAPKDQVCQCFTRALAATGYAAQGPEVLAKVDSVLAEADRVRDTIEHETACKLRYPFLEFGAGEQRVFATHGDVCDFMLLFDRLEHPCGGLLGRLCRGLAGVRGIRRTDVFGFYDWIYAEAKRSVEQFETFFKQPPAVLARLVAEFLTSDYARRALPRWSRPRVVAVAAVTAISLKPVGTFAVWWRKTMGPRTFREAARGPRRRREPVNLGVYARWGFAVACALLPVVAAGFAWLVHRTYGRQTSLWVLLAELVLLALSALLLFAIGVAGIIWRERLGDVMITSLEGKEKWLRNAMRRGWFGADAKDPAAFAHLILGHFHYPEQSPVPSTPSVTDAGAWIDWADALVLHSDQRPEYKRSMPLCTYVEVESGMATLYNYVDASCRWRFLGYQQVEGRRELCRCWEEVPVATPLPGRATP
jgi:UDP-2,3-diacylglucosamine pyrophosphatase LpxH